MTGKGYRTLEFPRTRLTTFDIGALSRRRHYVTALLELDVTMARRMLKEKRREGGARISFTAWLLKAIGDAVAQHREVAAFRCGKRRLMVFDDVNISILVEKQLKDRRIPLPLVIRRVNEKTAGEITAEIEKARAEKLEKEQMVLERGSGPAERMYYSLPGTIRRLAWRIMLRHPHFIFRKMGNVVFTSVGMMGRVNGWFVQTSVHPLSFGAGSIIRKPVVSGDEVRIAEMLHLTVLIDHDAVDGAPMARFIAALAERIESGAGV